MVFNLIFKKLRLKWNSALVIQNSFCSFQHCAFLFPLIFLSKDIKLYVLSRPRLNLDTSIRLWFQFLTFKTRELCILEIKKWQTGPIVGALGPTQFLYLLLFSFNWQNFGRQKMSYCVTSAEFTFNKLML